MILSFLLALVIGLCVLWLLGQYKHITFCEQLIVGMFVGISISVLILFLGGIAGFSLSLLPIYIVCGILLLLLIYKQYTSKTILHGRESIKNDVKTHWQQFIKLVLRKKIACIGILCYIIYKVYMVFSINVLMPTFDEDAVAGWDIKTKIFYETKSLVTDNSNIEFLGTDLSRYPFAGLVDVFFLLPLHQENIVGLTNIVSPLVYALSLLLLIGIFMRLTNIFFSSIVGYVFVSMPFLFVHGIGSYWNFISGFLLFLVIFYTIDQYSNNKNRGIIIPVIPIAILFGLIRNESLPLLIVTSLLLVIYELMTTKKYISTYSIYLCIAPVIVFLGSRFITSLYPPSTIINTTSGTNVGFAMIPAMFENIIKPGVFTAPFSQVLLHPDYNLFFLLFFVSLLSTIITYKKSKYIIPFWVISLVLIGIFLVTLYANVEYLGLLSHFAFIRYPLGIVHLLIFVTGYSFYHLHQSLKSGK